MMRGKRKSDINVNSSGEMKRQKGRGKVGENVSVNYNINK